MNETKEQEFIDKAAKKPKRTLPSVLEMLQFELREHMKIALEYKKKIDEAKTNTKKQYYHKKLKKNNIQAMKVLTAIENMTQQKAAVYESPKQISK